MPLPVNHPAHPCKGQPQDNIDFDPVAKKTDHFSGADLKKQSSIKPIEAKLREAMKKPAYPNRSTTMISSPASRTHTDDKEWFRYRSARNSRFTPTRAGLYDDILKSVKYT